MRSELVVTSLTILLLLGSNIGSLRAIEEVPRLVEAARQGDTASLRAQLQTGVRPTVASADGTTALHWAAFHGDLEEVELLLKAGAKATVKNRYGVAPLSLAAEAGSRVVIERLIQAGADANTALPGGETALHTAARNGSPEAVEVLLERGAQVDPIEETRAQTPLMWAAARGHVEAMKVLVDWGADMYARSRMPPEPEGLGIYEPYSARSIGGRGTGVTGGTITNLGKSKEQEIAPDANAYGQMTPLIMAVRENQVEAVHLLLDRGANVNDKAVVLKRGGAASALVLAVANANYELAVDLLKHGADATSAEQGWTALHELSYGRSEKYATRRNGPGWTPGPQLKGGVSGLDLARELVHHGAAVDARITRPMATGYRGGPNKIGATPFFLAAKAADFELMRVLKELGADPSLTNVDGETPLFAALNGVAGEDQAPPAELLETAKVCLEFKCDFNKPAKASDGSAGWTPLHTAASRGLNDIITLLVEHGASLTATLDPEAFKKPALGRAENIQTPIGGWTPLAIAEGWQGGTTFGHPDTAALLRKLMAERGIPIPTSSSAGLKQNALPEATSTAAVKAE